MESYENWVNDRAPRLGASLAFYTMLSLAPMLVVVVGVASMIYGERAAQGRLVWEIQGLVGEQGALAIQGLLRSARGIHGGVVATLVGLAALFFGAGAVFVELRDALNTIWKAPLSKAQSRWRTAVNMLRERAVSFGLVLAIGFLLVVSLMLNAWISLAGRYFGGFTTPQWAIEWGYAILSFLVIGTLFALLYKMLPDVCIEWGDVALGAGLTSVLFTVGKVLIGLYLGKATLLSAYGAAGSLVIVLVWVYYSAQIFFFGAEFTRVYTERHGSAFRRQLQLHPAKTDVRVEEPRTETAAPAPALIIPESFGEAKRKTA